MRDLDHYPISTRDRVSTIKIIVFWTRSLKLSFERDADLRIMKALSLATFGSPFSTSVSHLSLIQVV